MNKFDRWAFGCDPSRLTINQVMQLWNSRHGDKLLLDEKSQVFPDLCRMGGLFYEYKNEPKGLDQY